MTIILDTSALICFVKKEPGWESVIERLIGKTYMSSVNFAEFYTWVFRNKLNTSHVQELISVLKITCVDFDNLLALEAGKIYLLTSKFGLSLGDRACLVLSRKLNGKALTCDRSWAVLSHDFDIELLR